jgi:glycosyltransferase involved in cell wall biosynthesis
LGFKKYLPNAIIYVYDNRSTDNTAAIARNAGAIVAEVPVRGKGNVIRKMFADIDADIYVIVDGDCTYTAEDAPKMVNLLMDEKLDMVIAVRKEKSKEAYKKWHKIGNKIFNLILRLLFNSTFSDVFSGYRAFSRRFVKTFPAASDGFDIEAELSIHALTLSVPFAEIESPYLVRPKNSYSKLNTFQDGFKILLSIIRFLKETRPLFFFGTISIILFLLSFGISIPVILAFLKSGLEPKFSTAMLACGIMMTSFVSLACGIILDSISQVRKEIKRLCYLKF